MTRADAAICGLLFLGSLAGYAVLALRLSAGRYSDYFNLAFDFDPLRVVDLLTSHPADGFGFKHPFMLLFRPLGLAAIAVGLPAKAAAALVVAALAAGREALVYLFVRGAHVGRPEAFALALLFAVSGTQLTTAMVTETYGFALLSLVVVWLIAQQRLHEPSRLAIWRYPMAIVTAGITITNAMQPAIAELAVAWQRFGLLGALPRLARVGAICGVGFLAVAFALWPSEIVAAVRDPAQAARNIWWLQTRGTTVGLGKVLETFLAFSFVSPDYTIVTLPETTRMVDFRDWSFSAIGGVAVVGWLGFLAAGTFAGLAHKGFRPMACALLAGLALNVAFHLDFQYRGSVYLYAAHTHFLVFALSAGLAPWLAGRAWARVGYTGAVLALAGLVAAANVPEAAAFAARFDVPDTSCAAPCNDGLP